MVASILAMICCNRFLKPVRKEEVQAVSGDPLGRRQVYQPVIVGLGGGVPRPRLVRARGRRRLLRRRPFRGEGDDRLGPGVDPYTLPPRFHEDHAGRLVKGDLHVRASDRVPRLCNHKLPDHFVVIVPTHDRAVDPEPALAVRREFHNGVRPGFDPFVDFELVYGKAMIDIFTCYYEPYRLALLDGYRLGLELELPGDYFDL